jgi:hypothetical protein
MIVLNVTNVHEALPQALHLLHTRGVRQESRNGPVLVVPEPVATVYARPCERVLFHPWRDANPFFHFYESLWMLAGRRDIKPLVRYAKQIANYSDDGQTMNAAYGYRWRIQHGDQLKAITRNLRKNPQDRRNVLQIWDADADLATGYEGKDAACNLTATFQIVNDQLDMCVFCRSNDIIWGCYGANAVHFSFLLEYMARRIGVAVGTYTQISVNWHGYLSTVEPMLEYHSHEEGSSPYETEPVYPHPIATIADMDAWDKDCSKFVTTDGQLPARRTDFHDSWFDQVAWPIVLAHDRYKEEGSSRFDGAMSALEECGASDWKLACSQWIQRREKKAMEKK